MESPKKSNSTCLSQTYWVYLQLTLPKTCKMKLNKYFFSLSPAIHLQIQLNINPVGLLFRLLGPKKNFPSFPVLGMQSDIPPELQLGIIFSNSSTNSYWHCKVNHVSEPCPSHRKYWSSISSTMSSVSFPWNSTYKHFRDSETSLDPPEMIKKKSSRFSYGFSTFISPPNDCRHASVVLWKARWQQTGVGGVTRAKVENRC